MLRFVAAAVIWISDKRTIEIRDNRESEGVNAIRDMVKSKYSVWFTFTQRLKVINRKTEGMFSQFWF